MMADPGTVRNLEQIQEDDSESRTPRSVTLAFVALGGACVVFAALALRTPRTAVLQRADPLGELVAQRRAASAKATDLAPHDVTFPQILSDGDHPTTALAAVRGAHGASSALSMAPGPSGAVSSPPPAADRLPVVPLPAQNVLEATPVVTRPRDALTKAAADSAHQASAASASVPAGREGGYQLQVSSFRGQQEAHDFAEQLRSRGHKAHVVEAHVTGRGTWYRVRVGPFATQQAAASYRSAFEAKEHVVPFVVQPVSTK